VDPVDPDPDSQHWFCVVHLKLYRTKDVGYIIFLHVRMLFPRFPRRRSTFSLVTVFEFRGENNLSFCYNSMLAMQERLTEMFAENPQLSERVNIGFKSPSKDLSGESVPPVFNSSH
jgi:hypothetical protein